MVTMIAAVDTNNGIGYNNNLLFHSKEDMKHFRNITLGKTVVMGRKTAQSLPRGFLPDRNNLILSSSPESEYSVDGFFVRTTRDSVEDVVNKYSDVIVIGGGSVYEQFMGYADKIYLTRFDYKAGRCDTYFPDIGGDFRERFIRRGLLSVNVLGVGKINVSTTFLEYDRQ